MSKGLLIPRQDYLNPNPLWHALRLHDRCSGVGSQAQDCFSFDAMRALAFEPLAHPSLHPEKWKKLHAGLEIAVRLTKTGRLALDVSPWPERSNLASKFKTERFEDFIDFPANEDARGRPTITIFELQLDELKSELRGTGVNPDTAAISARRLISLSYDHVISNLARHFEVRVETALLCLGDECRLLLRKMSSLENQVERPYLPASSVSWHDKYVALCTQAGVTPDELLELYTTSLAPLSETGRLSFLRQYLGNPSKPVARRSHRAAARAMPDPTRMLLRSLLVVASPEVFPPLRDHPAMAVEQHLLELATSAPNAGVATIADQYCFDVEAIQNLLRLHYPEVLLAALESTSEIRAELEYSVAKRPDQVKLITELEKRMLLRLEQAWDGQSPDTLANRRRRMVKDAGFRSFPAMKDWAEQNAPQLLVWLNSL